MATQDRVACVLLQQAEDVTAFAEACFRFSPQIAIRPGEAVFIEVGASRGLFSEASIEARLKVLARRLLKSPVRVAIAEAAAPALAAARYPEYAQTRDLKRLPLEALMDYASPFRRDGDLQKKILRMTCILESLGMKTLGEFALLPRESLASRLGKDAVALTARVWGEAYDLVWPGFHPLPKIMELDEVQDPEAHGICADLEGCLFVLRGLVDRAMARLRGRGERASVIQLRFRTDTKWNREWRVELPLPQGSVSALLPILREKLSHELQRSPLGAPVEAIQIEILESVPGGGTQRDFFSKKEEEHEAWDALVARLSSKLGKERVFVAFPQERYLPERAYLRKVVSVPSLVVQSVADAEACVDLVERVGAQSTSFILSESPDRPARVLKKPEPLQKDGRVLTNLSGKRWKVVNWQGPERLSSEWWKDAQFEGFNRDYYRVLTEGGEQLWVFQNRKSKTPSFYLHGYFD